MFYLHKDESPATDSSRYRAEACISLDLVWPGAYLADRTNLSQSPPSPPPPPTLCFLITSFLLSNPALSLFPYPFSIIHLLPLRTCSSSFSTLLQCFLGDFLFFFVLYSTLLHLLPLRFHCADWCWDRTQDRCNWWIGSQTLFQPLIFTHCNENPIHVFLFWELRGLSPNFHILVSVSDLYIPSIGSTYFLQQNR
jgi:hypothetical protein